MRIHCKETTPDIRLAHKFGCDPDLEAPELLALAQALDLEVMNLYKYYPCFILHNLFPGYWSKLPSRSRMLRFIDFSKINQTIENTF